MTRNPKDIAAETEDRTDYSVVPPAPLRALARAMMLGAGVYGRWNWRRHSVSHRVYFSAAQRHLEAIARGETADPESGEPHEAHVMANMAIIIDAREAGKLHEDILEIGEPRGNDHA